MDPTVVAIRQLGMAIGLLEAQLADAITRLEQRASRIAELEARISELEAKT